MTTSDSSLGVFMQMFIVSPTISWILKPGRYSKRRGLIYAVTALVAIAAITIGMDVYDQKENFYYMVGIGRDASFADIKRVFRQRSVELHPDKNPSPTATEEFNRLRLAFDILGDANKRPLYDVYGENAVEKDLWAIQIETLAGTLTYYAMWAVLTFIMTLSETARDARAWSLAAGVLCFILELNFIYGDARLPSFFFPMMTIHDFVAIMHTAFPLFMNGCRAIGGYFHYDVAQENLKLSVELLKSNQALLLSMRQLQGEVASSSRRRPEIVKDETIAAAARRRLKMEKHPVVSLGAALTPDERAAALEELRDIAIPEPQVENTGNGLGIPRWVWAVATYFALNYLFSN